MYMFLVSLSFRLTNVQTGCNILFFKFYNWPFNIVIIINNKNYFNNMLKMQNTFPQLQRNGYSVTFLILHLIKPFLVGWRIPKKINTIFNKKILVTFSLTRFNGLKKSLSSQNDPTDQMNHVLCCGWRIKGLVILLWKSGIHYNICNDKVRKKILDTWNK